MEKGLALQAKVEAGEGGVEKRGEGAGLDFQAKLETSLRGNCNSAVPLRLFPGQTTPPLAPTPHQRHLSGPAAPDTHVKITSPSHPTAVNLLTQEVRSEEFPGNGKVTGNKGLEFSQVASQLCFLVGSFLMLPFPGPLLA